ncbi:phosphoglycerate kinase [Haloarchaeobius sp. HME9146]|uniref:phosphoglycerate kinase n=1 Tax=Haloarchaeobius sp. HME9146 TaxID=2978732 RepID=UPI0021BFBC7E|nr:phosphoglycerate kinase [Haloarchaeobius sp. HME9146]MCT9096622.1 phosphoglycerate kinase [Haloarchaeobius sp. HME9146]
MPVGTLDDLTVADRRVGVRVDINSPLSDGGLADDARLQAHEETLSELLERGARLAILAHQGRPGGDDFETLAAHAERLDEMLDYPVSYVDATFSSAARDAVTALDSGEAVVLENTRFYAEEYMEFDPAKASQTHLVEGLVPVLDAYVNDAFAAAHRSQPSLVGFPERLPSYAGRVMERELDVLGDIESTDRPRVYVLGGAKVPDSIDVAWSVLENDLADTVLTAGVVGNVFLAADGVDLGDTSMEFIMDQGYWDEIDRAADLLDAHGDRIRFPQDVAVERDGERREIGMNALPGNPGEAAMDIGEGTLKVYRSILEDAETVILNGPAGVFEEPLFEYGTRELYAAAGGVPDSIVGGGDTAAAIRKFGLEERFGHFSTGGGACLRMLTDGELPAVEALRRSHDD